MIDVSATLVASTIRRPRCGCQIRCCSADAEPGVQRQHLGVAQLAFAERVGGVVDLALAREEHQDVAVALGGELVAGVEDRVDLVRARRPGSRYRISTGYVRPDTVTIGAGSPAASAKCAAKRSVSMVADVTITLQVRPLGQQLPEVAEDEVDVQAALVGLVDDQGVVAAQHPVALDLGEQDAVGHHPDAASRSLTLSVKRTE